MERLIFDFAFRAVLIAAAAVIILRTLRIQTAAAQHAVWTGMLVVMLALPFWILWGPKAALPVLPTRGGPGLLTTVASAVEAVDSTPAVPARLEASKPASTPAWNWGAFRSWNAMWIGAYLLGAGALLLRLVVGTIRANRLTGTSCVAPVTVGWLRPRIILPDSSREWPETQLDAVLVHERAHVRRRDPLVQWLALLNRALFWFHPLAWWLERRLSALAEEACDFAVLEQGHDPNAYSEYLLEIARMVQSAGIRMNVTGMAMPGSYLPRRIRKIIAGASASSVSPARMTGAVVACVICTAMFAAGTLEHVARIQLTGTLPPEVRAPIRKPLPATAEPVRNSAPVFLAQVTATPAAPNPLQSSAAIRPSPRTPLTFEVSSVKPGTVPNGITVSGNSMIGSNRDEVHRLQSTGGPGTNDPGRIHYPIISLRGLLSRAYDSYFEIRGPGWLDTDVVQVDATMPPDTTKEQFREMLGNLIKKRFNLRYHVESKEIAGYSLVVAKNGPTLKESVDASAPQEPNRNAPQSAPEPLQIGPDGFRILPPGPAFAFQALRNQRARIFSQHQPMEQLAKGLGTLLKCPVIDTTGLKSKYDFTVNYAGGIRADGPYAQPQAAPDGPATPVRASDSAGLPDIFSALQSQLGLKLEPKKIAREIMVVDHMEKTPTRN